MKKRYVLFLFVSILILLILIGGTYILNQYLFQEHVPLKYMIMLWSMYLILWFIGSFIGKIFFKKDHDK